MRVPIEVSGISTYDHVSLMIIQQYEIHREFARNGHYRRYIYMFDARSRATRRERRMLAVVFGVT